jgi:hypothetical protein
MDKTEIECIEVNSRGMVTREQGGEGDGEMLMVVYKVADT